MPSLAGQTYDDAANALKKLTLIPSEEQVSNDRVTSGSVISTTPGARSKVGPHTKVVVMVSSGPAALSVPNLVGMTVDAATAQLKQDGLKLGTTTPEDSASIATGLVVDSSPASGAQISSGGTVNIMVASGNVNIPSVVGKSGADAGAALTALHISYSVIPNPGCSNGNVTAQSAVGEQPQTISMTITVCTGG
ncbi:MAG: PASTA domain-containing protein [Galbitalea sp.]